MDSSIFEKAFALRDEAQRAQLDASSLDLSDSHGLAESADKGELISPPQADLAARFLRQAVALHEEASTPHKQDASTTAFLASVLAAATAPIGRVDASALALDVTVASETVAKAAPKAASKAAPKAAPKPKPRLKRKPKK